MRSRAGLRSSPVARRARARACERTVRTTLRPDRARVCVAPRATSEGPLDYASRAAAALPDSAEAIDAITRTYVRLRYEPNDGRTALATLKRLVQESQDTDLAFREVAAGDYRARIPARAGKWDVDVRAHVPTQDTYRQIFRVHLKDL